MTYKYMIKIITMIKVHLRGAKPFLGGGGQKKKQNPAHVVKQVGETS